MSPRSWRLLLGLLLLLSFAACGGGSDSGGFYSSDARITLQAQFEKRPLTAAGFGATTLRPARYCWAEVRDAGSGALLSSGYLGSDGTGTTTVPRGLQVYVQVFAQYQVPSADPASFFMRGSVKNAPEPGGAMSLSAFTAIPTWSVTSNTFLADRDGTLSVTALASNRIAGAFNIADQAVAFGAAVRDMDGSATLRLPNLHTFWTTSLSAADQQRTYPAVLSGSSSSILVSDSGRALFGHQVYGQGSGAANTETDEWDDGVLQETFARLLFADYSFKPDGSTSLSLLRRDNDNVWVDRAVQSESTAAFVAGFSDFLSAAVRNNSQLLDSYVDGGGLTRVDAFDLADHTYVPAAAKGEFARGSIAVSLWGLWKNVLGGSPSGLNTLWAAVRSTTPYANGTGEYEQATLGCYPTYLQGVASRVTATTWNAALAELALESVPNPDASYFAGPALWQTVSLPLLNASGSLQTYDPGTNLYYDRNQSQAWRFVHPGGARTLTMTPTGGQDFYLELIGPGGWVAGSYSNPGSIRTLNLTSLPVGTYVARVRAGATTATGTYGYTLSIN
ncbi:hypothetical protein [Geothrix fermentans]|uniref:hypothetical protein n=1 Tax=Geothrix fermentans TaxID=44676 RepID=UPI00041E6A51|nr:hypothetical protein [Geothrix fermentans]